MWGYRVTVTVDGHDPVSITYRTPEKAIKNAGKVIAHATKPVIMIEPVIITEPGA